MKNLTFPFFMAKKKNKNYRFNVSRDFLKTVLIVAAIGGVIWFWQNSKFPSRKTLVKKPDKVVKVVKNESEKPTSQPVETQTTPSAKSLTQTFSKETWLDDYLQIQTDLDRAGQTDLIIASGTVSTGVDPETIKNREKLHPQLLIVRKKNGAYLKLDRFDFSTALPTEGGIQGNALTGIPRITKNSLVDLNKDGHPEIQVLLDTPGKWTEAVTFLKWENGKLHWIKTQDKKGNEKIALWLSGSTATEAQEIATKNIDNEGHGQVIQKTGKLDAAHPEKGFQWKTTVWEYRDGMLKEK